MILILILEIQCRYQSDSSDSPGTGFTAVINVALFQSLSSRLKTAPGCRQPLTVFLRNETTGMFRRGELHYSQGFFDDIGHMLSK